LEDIFGCSQQPSINNQQTQPLPLTPNNDPWAAFETQQNNISALNGANGFQNNQNGKIGQQRSNLKTPESFLGGLIIIKILN
jgi:hypothetical protein